MTQMFQRFFHPITLNAAVLALAAITHTVALAQPALVFTEEQVKAGQASYRATCQICHGSSLANGQFGTPLRGAFFQDKWKGKSVGELLQLMMEKMPPDNVNSLSPEQGAALLAYIFFRNDIAAGSEALVGDVNTLGSVMLPW